MFDSFPGLAEVLVKDAISHLFLNPFIWVYAVYKVQRELYMFLIQQFDNDPRLLKGLCRFPRVLDIIHQFYWDNMPYSTGGSKAHLQPITNKIFGERPNKEEIQKIRLLLLSIGEMSLRYVYSSPVVSSKYLPCSFFLLKNTPLSLKLIGRPHSIILLLIITIH